jgi:hypothetical protein
VERGNHEKNLDVFRMFHEFLNECENNGRTWLLYSNFSHVSGCMIVAKFWNQEVAEV